MNNDRLHYHIQDGVRTMVEKERGTKIKAGIEKAKKRTPTEEGPEAKKTKKFKAVYLVNPKKFDSVATARERAREFSQDDLGSEETHRILQNKIR